MPNAPKLNNAWWRWFGSGPRNPPVTIRLDGSAKVHRLGTILGRGLRAWQLLGISVGRRCDGSDPPASTAHQPNPHQQRPSWSRARAFSRALCL